MKRVLAAILCIMFVLTLSVSVSAGPSVESGVVVIKGNGSHNGVAMPKDTYVPVDEYEIITAVADEKTYGTFNYWTIYTIEETVNGGAGSATTYSYGDAKEGVDYEILSGYSLKTKTIKIKRLGEKRLAICGNYNGKITDPLKTSDAPGKTPSKSPKDGDLSVIYVALVALGAAALVYGVKRRILSK